MSSWSASSGGCCVVLGLIVLAPACGFVDERVLILPEPQGESGVLGISSGDSIEVRAFEAEAGPKRLVRAFHNEASFELHYYEEPLSELMLDEGPLVRSPGSSRRLPDNPIEIFVAHLSNAGELEPWSPTPETGRILSGFELPPGPETCRELSPETVHVLPAEATLLFQDPADASVVIILTKDPGVALRFDLSTRDAQELAITPPPVTALRSRLVTPDGSLLLGAEQIYRAQLTASELRLEAFFPESELDDAINTSTGTVPVSYQHIAGEFLSQTEFELIALDRLGRLWSLEPGGKRLLHAFADPPSIGNVYGGLVRIGPRDYLASSSDTSAVAHIQDGELSFEDSGEGTFDLATVEGLGVVGGGALGRVLFRAGGWMTQSAGTGSAVRLLVPLGPRRFLFGSLGLTGEYRDGEFCPLIRTPGASSPPRGALEMDHQLVAVVGTDLLIAELAP